MELLFKREYISGPKPPRKIDGECAVCHERNLRESIYHEVQSIEHTVLVRRVICWCCGWIEETRSEVKQNDDLGFFR